MIYLTATISQLSQLLQLTCSEYISLHNSFCTSEDVNLLPIVYLLLLLYQLSVLVLCLKNSYKYCASGTQLPSRAYSLINLYTCPVSTVKHAFNTQVCM